MEQKKKKDYIKKFMRWLLFAMTIIRHFKKIRPELAAAGQNIKASGRKIIIRIAVITVETVATAGYPVKIGPYDTRPWAITKNDDKIKYAATLLFNKFLFEDQTYADLKTLTAGYFPSVGGAK